jgi:hypothetical protein
MKPQFNLQEEAEYVLGMMDMYPNDKDVVSMLKLKGFGDEEIDQVFQLIKHDGYKKRIRQSKIIMVIGFLIMAVLGCIWLYVGTERVYNPNEDRLSRVSSRMIIKPIFYGFLYGIGQTIYGLYRYIVYSYKLSKSIKSFN